MRLSRGHPTSTFGSTRERGLTGMDSNLSLRCSQQANHQTLSFQIHPQSSHVVDPLASALYHVCTRGWGSPQVSL